MQHFDEIINFIKDEKPIVCCLTETYIIKEVENNEIEIPGYNIVRCNSKSNRTGGVIVYLKKYIKYEILDIRECEINMWIITLNCMINNSKKCITTIYHSPGSSDANFF